MEHIVKDRVIEILGKVLNALRRKDDSGLKILSNYTIHNASIFQDEDSISIAIIAYALSKIVQRYKFDETKEWVKFYGITIEHIKNIRKNIVNNSIEQYQSGLKELFKAILLASRLIT